MSRNPARFHRVTKAEKIYLTAVSNTWHDYLSERPTDSIPNHKHQDDPQFNSRRPNQLKKFLGNANPLLEAGEGAIQSLVNLIREIFCHQ